MKEAEIPTFLKKGDRIAITATAGRIDPAKIENAELKLRQWGYEVVVGKHAKGMYNQFSATDLQRASDLQSFLDDSGVKAILCARGGYGTARILPYTDWTRFGKNPKWIIGYSDITVIHSVLEKLNIAGIHGPMAVNFPDRCGDDEGTDTLKQILYGKFPLYEIPPHPLNRTGITSGPITGGNLSIICSLRGTPYDIDTRDKILFIEEVGEYLYHIDRMMTNLRLSDKLSCLKGMIIGGMTELKDNPTPFGKEAYEIIAEAVSSYKYPVCFGFPSGHIVPNKSYISGKTSILEINENGSIFRQSL